MPVGNHSDKIVREAIEQSGGNYAEAARILGVSRGAIWNWRVRQQEAGQPKVDVTELRRAETKIAQLKDEIKEERKKRTDAEREAEQLKESYAASVSALDKHRKVKLSRPSKSGKGGSATAVICCTDWHAESKVDPELVNNLNRVDLTVTSKRIKRTWEKSLYMYDFASNISNINETVLWLGGDLVNGAIHEELEETNFLGPADAVLFVQDHLAAGIDMLLKELKGPIRVHTNNGNHGRTTRRKRFSTGYLHSWEYLAYQNLAKIYRREPRVIFSIAKGYHNVCVTQNRKIRFHHGDAIRFHGGVGGITVPVVKKIASWNKQGPVDLDVFGHFHTFLDHWSFCSIGCLVGYNEYAMELACDYQPPTQGFIVMDKEYGKVLAAPIYCQAKDE